MRNAVFTICFTAVCLLITAAACDSREAQMRRAADRKQYATESAHEHAKALGYELIGVACSPKDSDRNGYTSCTARIKGGETLDWECGYTTSSYGGCKTRNSMMVTERER